MIRDIVCVAEPTRGSIARGHCQIYSESVGNGSAPTSPTPEAAGNSSIGFPTKSKFLFPEVEEKEEEEILPEPVREESPGVEAEGSPAPDSLSTSEPRVSPPPPCADEVDSAKQTDTVATPSSASDTTVSAKRRESESDEMTAGKSAKKSDSGTDKASQPQVCEFMWICLFRLRTRYLGRSVKLH